MTGEFSKHRPSVQPKFLHVVDMLSHAQAHDFQVLESSQALLVLQLSTMDLPNFTFPPDFNFQYSSSLQGNGNTSVDYPPYPPSMMAGHPFHATFPYSQSFDSRIDWDDPLLYQSVPSLSDLLNECHNMWDTLLPPAPQNNASDASHAINTSWDVSQQTTLPAGHEVLDANHAINMSQQATLPARCEVVNLNDHSGQQDNNEEAPLNSHVETGTSEVPADANNSSWATRNPDQPVLMSQAPLNTAQKAQANAQRAS
ncbi:hypothetical protein BDR06DRAFT_1011292 [Suillus hirtellus]|nr:hypothetical protein BDR06DRAFT_1011292 [Suillus hirtellus]